MPDSGRTRTCCENCNLSVDQGYSCSSTDSQSEACLLGLPQVADGSSRCHRSADTVRDSGNDAVSEAAPSRGQTASDASRALVRCPLLDHTEDALPTSSHSPCCSGGGCSCEGKKPMVDGNQVYWTQVQ